MYSLISLAIERGPGKRHRAWRMPDLRWVYDHVERWRHRITPGTGFLRTKAAGELGGRGLGIRMKVLN